MLKPVVPAYISPYDRRFFSKKPVGAGKTGGSDEYPRAAAGSSSLFTGRRTAADGARGQRSHSNGSDRFSMR